MSPAHFRLMDHPALVKKQRSARIGYNHLGCGPMRSQH
jgi:hypothetical protein